MTSKVNILVLDLDVTTKEEEEYRSLYILFIYLDFFYLYCFLVTGIIHKFKKFLKQRIIFVIVNAINQFLN